jgi:hypothetical protein
MASNNGGVSGPFGGPIESWRKHPMLRITHPKDVLPGFGTALALFALVNVGQWMWKSAGAPKLRPSGKSAWKDSSSSSGGHGHHNDHKTLTSSAHH